MEVEQIEKLIKDYTEHLESRIGANTDKLDLLTEQISNSICKISENSEKIQHNTGALSLLHTIKATSDKYFIMWIITFITLLASVAYIIFAG